MPQVLTPEAIESYEAEILLDAIMEYHGKSPVCLTCSFQAEDMIVLSLLKNRVPDVPVLFLETGYHFSDTCAFRDRIAAEWKLNLVNVIPKKTVAEQEAECGILYREDPAKCCHLRKVEPLMQSLEPFEIWFTGLRREQSTPPAERQIVAEGQSPRRLDLGTGVGIHGEAWIELLAAVRPRLRQHRV
jgi:phosphoadenosine phosphosulfate reductase